MKRLWDVKGDGHGAQAVLTREVTFCWGPHQHMVRKPTGQMPSTLPFWFPTTHQSQPEASGPESPPMSSTGQPPRDQSRVKKSRGWMRRWKDDPAHGALTHATSTHWIFTVCLGSCWPKVQKGRSQESWPWDFPGGLVANALHFHCRQSGFNPWSGEQDSTCLAVWPKKTKKKKKKIKAQPLMCTPDPYAYSFLFLWILSETFMEEKETPW